MNTSRGVFFFKYRNESLRQGMAISPLRRAKEIGADIVAARTDKGMLVKVRSAMRTRLKRNESRASQLQLRHSHECGGRDARYLLDVVPALPSSMVLGKLPSTAFPPTNTEI